MIKKLSIKMTLMFLGTTVVSLAIALFITIQVHQNQFELVTAQEVDRTKNYVIEQLNYLSPAQIEEISSTVTIFQINILEINENNNLLSKEKIQDILSKDDIVTIPDPNKRVFATPIFANNQEFILLLTTKKMEEFNVVKRAIFMLAGITLLIGSILVLIASRVIVLPIKGLTEHTKQLAKGNFSQIHNTSRKDEIGILTNSFNQMAKEINQLVKMRQDFVSNVTHEFQTPLTSITGFSKALQEKELTDQQRKHYLSIIERESKRLSSLSKNILRLSHLQYENYTLLLSHFSVDEQIRQVLITLEPQWSKKNLQINLELERVTIEADEEILVQVWVNLINNAIKFSEENNHISITCLNKHDEIEIRIMDEGIGMTEEQAQQLFIPFYQADTSRKKEGNGLGLSIVKEVIAHHHGTIHVESKIHEGTIFIITLPKKQREDVLKG